MKPQLGEKDLLTPEETVEYFGFSKARWYKFLNSPCSKDFVVKYRERRLILRVQFEKYLNKNKNIKEELTNVRKGRPKKRLEA